MEYQQGNIFFRVHDAPMMKGQKVAGHRHNFDHSTFCISGRLKLVRLSDGKISEISPGTFPELIEAGIKHEIEALEDNTQYMCLYAHRTPQGEVTQRYTGFTDAYR